VSFVGLIPASLRPAPWTARAERLSCEPARPTDASFERPEYVTIATAVAAATLVVLGRALAFDITLRAGFRWNGASIPRWLWWLVGSPFHPLFMVASAFHDALYQYGSRLGITRREADDLFFALLRADGVSLVRASAMWLAVRAFGRGHYQADPVVQETLVDVVAVADRWEGAPATAKAL